MTMHRREAMARVSVRGAGVAWSAGARPGRAYAP